MKLIDLFRFFKGYVTFEVSEGFLERFINLCTQRRIGIFDVKNVNSHIVAKISPKDFEKLNEIAIKSGSKIDIINESGLPFIISKNRHRVGLIYGSVFFLVFILIMNRFLWCVDSSGSEKYSKEQIIEVAQLVGVKQGVFLPLFDEKKAAREIYKYFDGELSWVSVNVKGSIAFIEVRDTKVPTEPQDEEPCNIIADFDGVILSDETLSGIKSITKGNAVKKGDLLISGVIENEDSSTVYYKAKGNFTATHKTIANTERKYDKKCCTYKNSESYICLHIFGVDIPIKFKGFGKEKTDTFKYTQYIKFFDMNLPFGYTRIFSVQNDDTISKKHVSYIYTCNEYEKETYEKYKNTNIISYKVNILNGTSSIAVTGEYDCIDFIGVEQPILIEKAET